MALLEFVLLGTVPAEPLPVPAPLALLFVAVGAVVAWYFLRGSAPGPATEAVATAARAMRRRSEQLPVLPLRDPDAAGRPRPRAPGRSLTAR
nr:DUF6412 domain-containing protein [Nocardiopsis algeriensis]